MNPSSTDEIVGISAYVYARAETGLARIIAPIETTQYGANGRTVDVAAVNVT